MAKDYELLFQMNALLDSKFSHVFNEATNRIGDLEKKLKHLDNVGRNDGFGKGIANSIGRIGINASKVLGLGVGAAIGGGILAGTVAIKSSIEKAMDFESQIKSIQALTGASNAEMTKMQGLALQMGAKTKYSALEAAQGIEELLKAGLKPASVQAGGLEAALNLATAGGLELAESASTMATALNGFKKDAMTAATVSNILAGTANAAATDVHELSYALASGGSVADMAGLSFKDFNTAIGLMSNDGLKSGSDAGTSFKSMLMYLQPQTKQATKLFNQLGIGVGKANKFFNKGKIKDIAGIAKVMHDAFDGMDEQTRTNKMLEMFGTDAIKAATSLFKAGADGVEKFQKAMMNVTALDVAKKKMDTASGAVEQFKGAIETLQISALLPTMPIIKRLASAAADTVTQYTPQITEAMERMVDRSENYVKTHFTNNPEFQRLTTLESKVKFIFDDVKGTFNKWWNTSGQADFEYAADKFTDTILTVLDNSVPQMAEIGAKMGLSIADGMLNGMKKSKSLGWLFKLQDSLTPDWWTKMWGDILGTGGSGGSYMPDTKIPFGSLLPTPGGSTSGPAKNNPANFSSDMRARQEAAKANSNASKLTAFQIGKRANGGYVTRPELSWIGEGRYPEWIIPQNNSDRSQGLWEAAGRSIGALPNNSSPTEHQPVSITYSPTIVIQGNGDAGTVKRAVEAGHADFEQRMDAYYTQKRRRSLG